MKGFICLIALWASEPAQTKPIEITVDGGFGPTLQRNFQAIANDVALIVSDLFSGSRPPVDCPITCYLVLASAQRPLPVPETTLDDWRKPSQIRVSVTVNGPYYAQFVYQLSHELGHVMLDPRRTNGVIETIASAVAYEILDRMADRWAMIVPFPYLRGYGENFRKYRSDDEAARLKRLLDVQPAVAKRDWNGVSQYLYHHRPEQDQVLQAEIGSEHGRDIQALGAMALRESHINWRKLAGISLKCSSLPLSKQAAGQPPAAFSAKCLATLPGILCPIGRGCPGLSPEVGPGTPGAPADEG